MMGSLVNLNKLMMKMNIELEDLVNLEGSQ
jgi:hypothetical protein